MAGPTTDQLLLVRPACILWDNIIIIRSTQIQFKIKHIITGASRLRYDASLEEEDRGQIQCRPDVRGHQQSNLVEI